MNLDAITDFANSASDEIARYSFQVTISPERLQNTDFIVDELQWDSINYGDAEIERVPDDKRGVYAFAIAHENQVLPPHGYILYIGIAGRRSRRSIRARYRDYLNEKKILERARIARMIGHWSHVLRFYFAPVNDDLSSEDLEKIETQLNTALLPPFSEGDVEADVKKKRRAF